MWCWDQDAKTTFHYPFLSPSGPRFRGYMRPHELMEEFVGSRAVEIILAATNKRLKERLARQLNRQEPDKRVHDNLNRIHDELKEAEFWRFTAVVVFMTQAPLRSWESFWRSDECPSPLPSANFTKRYQTFPNCPSSTTSTNIPTFPRRFEAILLSLSPTPPHEEGPDKKQLQAHKHVEELTEALVTQWNRVYAAPAHLSADETLSKFSAVV